MYTVFGWDKSKFEAADMMAADHQARKHLSQWMEKGDRVATQDLGNGRTLYIVVSAGEQDTDASCIVRAKRAS